MAARVPPNHPLSMTGYPIIDWIVKGEKYGLTYPNDYKVDGLPAGNVIDLAKTYFLVAVEVVPTKGYIHQNVTGDLVEAVELTGAVSARLSDGGGISSQQVNTLVSSWNDQTPDPKKALDIRNLIAEGGVSY